MSTGDTGRGSTWTPRWASQDCGSLSSRGTPSCDLLHTRPFSDPSISLRTTGRPQGALASCRPGAGVRGCEDAMSVLPPHLLLLGTLTPPTLLPRQPRPPKLGSCAKGVVRGLSTCCVSPAGGSGADVRRCARGGHCRPPSRPAGRQLPAVPPTQALAPRTQIHEPDQRGKCPFLL